MPAALLIVFMEVGSQATEEEFHDWYSNDHLPARTQLLPTFRSAARYYAIDGSTPKYTAMYAVSDPATFTSPEYTGLRDKRSAHEADLMGRLELIDRRIYTLLSDTTPPPEDLRPSSIAAGTVIFNSFTPAEGSEDAFNTWYEETYIPKVKTIPGWSRTRRYKLDGAVFAGLKKAEAKPVPKYLEVTEFDIFSNATHSKFLSETDGLEVISTATQSERRVFKLLKSFEPTAALRALRTPAGTPSVATPGIEGLSAAAPPSS